MMALWWRYVLTGLATLNKCCGGGGGAAGLSTEMEAKPITFAALTKRERRQNAKVHYTVRQGAVGAGWEGGVETHAYMRTRTHAKTRVFVSHTHAHLLLKRNPCAKDALTHTYTHARIHAHTHTHKRTHIGRRMSAPWLETEI